MSLQNYQTQFLELINNYRQGNGLQPLAISPILTNASIDMSQDMANNNIFSHTDSNGRGLQQRINLYNYIYSALGENIAAGNQDAVRTFEQWKNSPAHNANMLNSAFREIGIGRAYNPSSTYKWYWTTIFGTPRNPNLNRNLNPNLNQNQNLFFQTPQTFEQNIASDVVSQPSQFSLIPNNQNPINPDQYQIQDNPNIYNIPYYQGTNTNLPTINNPYGNIPNYNTYQGPNTNLNPIESFIQGTNTFSDLLWIICFILVVAFIIFVFTKGTDINKYTIY